MWMWCSRADESGGGGDDGGCVDTASIGGHGAVELTSLLTTATAAWMATQRWYWRMWCSRADVGRSSSVDHDGGGGGSVGRDGTIGRGCGAVELTSLETPAAVAALTQTTSEDVMQSGRRADELKSLAMAAVVVAQRTSTAVAAVAPWAEAAAVDVDVVQSS